MANIFSIISSKELNYSEKRTYIRSHFGELNKSDRFGRTPLHYAVARGEQALIRLLLAWGAEINKKDLFGHTPLHEAVMLGKSEIVAILFENNARIDLKSVTGKLPIDFAENKSWSKTKDTPPS